MPSSEEADQALRSIFNDDDEDVDGHQEISHHEWKIEIDGTTTDDGDKDVITIYYHLAFLAPGHGDSLWNSCACIAEHLLDPNRRPKLLGTKVQDKIEWPPNRSLEFGAGAALPSLVLLKQGAKRVTLTDKYVNRETFDALAMSVKKNCLNWNINEEDQKERATIMPHSWGEDIEKLLTTDEDREEGIDVLVASDCIYNPTYHGALLSSASHLISKERGIFIVGYSFHLNVPPDKVLDFFTKATSEYDFEIASELEKEYEEQTVGIDKNRAAVYVKVLVHKDSIYCQ